MVIRAVTLKKNTLTVSCHLDWYTFTDSWRNYFLLVQVRRFIPWKWKRYLLPKRLDAQLRDMTSQTLIVTSLDVATLVVFSFVCAFAKLREAAISYVMFVCPSIHME